MKNSNPHTLTKTWVGERPPDLEFENGHARLVLYGCTMAMIEACRPGLKFFEVDAGLTGIAFVRFIYIHGHPTIAIVLKPDSVRAAGLLNPAARLVNLSIWVQGPAGQKKVCERPAVLRPRGIRIELTELHAGLGLLGLEGKSGPTFDVTSASALYSFLPAGTKFEVLGEELVILAPELPIQARDEACELFNSASTAIETQDRVAEAAHLFGRVLDKDSTLNAARMGLINALMLLREWEGAKRELRRVLLLDPTCAIAWHLLAGLNNGRDLPLTERYLKRAAELAASPSRGARTTAEPACVNPRRGVYMFSRAEAEASDFRHFLSVYGLEKLPTGRPLRELMGKVTLVVDGYNDVRVLCGDPVVRQFFQALHAAWPYWLYFCNLNTPIFRTLVSCCLPTFEVVTVEGKGRAEIRVPLHEMADFVRSELESFYAMCARAGVPERVSDERIKALFDYLGLPFPVNLPS